MIEIIRQAFESEKVYYSRHAKDEMENEEFGEIKDNEIYEAILNGRIIKEYPEDKPYPSYLIHDETNKNRYIHVVCAYSSEDELAVIITVYQPDPSLWDDSERRKT